MARALGQLGVGKKWLVCVASPRECGVVRAGLDPERFDVCETGVGKAAAAAATALAFDAGVHAGVISLGIGGALPGSALDLGDVVVGERAVFADEGLLAPDGFTTVDAMGFPPPGSSGGGAYRTDEALRSRLAPLAKGVGAIATVSTCSGTDALAREVARRSGALVEAMEGAGVALACALLGRRHQIVVAFAEVRIVSNTTGDRAAQRWDLDGALARLGAIARAL